MADTDPPGRTAPCSFDRIVIDHFAFRGYHGCSAFCKLELIRLVDGRMVAIATELQDNPGTSITNVAEYLASEVCVLFQVEPDKLVWIEYYGYPVPGDRKRRFDRVTFGRRAPEKIAWSPAILRSHPSGWPGQFREPQWRPMEEKDWQELGLTPPPAAP